MQCQDHDSESELAEVVTSFPGGNNDELDLIPGQIIEIISKELEDPGWWMGRLNGSIGIFPEQFVKIVSAQCSCSLPSPPEISAVHELSQPLFNRTMKNSLEDIAEESHASSSLCSSAGEEKPSVKEFIRIFETGSNSDKVSSSRSPKKSHTLVLQSKKG